MWQRTPYAVILMIGALFSALTAAYVLRRRRYGRWIMTAGLLSLSSAVWLLGNALELASTGLDAKLWWDKVQFIGICFLPTGWLVFTLQYTGRDHWLSRRALVLLTTMPLLILILVFTNEFHGLIWKSYTLSYQGAFVAKKSAFGIALWGYFFYAYVVVAAGILLLVQALVRSRHLFRWQGSALLVAVCMPWLINLLAEVAGWELIPNFELTPLALAVTMPLAAWSFSRLRFRDIMPVARDVVLDSMTDGVIVLDARARIVDVNPAAQRLIGRPKLELVGQIITEAWMQWLVDVPFVPINTENSVEVSLIHEGKSRIFDVRRSPLTDWRGRLVSQVMVLRDVTDRKQVELENARLLNETQQRLKEQTTLCETGAILSATLDLGQVLNLIVRQIGQALDATSVYICTIQDKRAVYVVEAEFIGPEADEREGFSDLGAEYPILDEEARFLATMRAGQYEVSYLTDPGLSEVERAHMEQYDAQTILYVPLWARDELLGFIEVWDSRQEREFTEQEIALCYGIAHQAAIALANARLYEQAQREIAERQRAEEQLKASLHEKEILLKEVHHRVKNNMQVISSLLNLQSTQVHDREALVAFRESTARIRSMALIHEKLYQSENLACIDFADYIQNLVAYLMQAYSVGGKTIDINIRADQVQLGIDSAMPCGLVLNELVSNCLKHAFPDGRAGKVCIELTRDGDGWVVLRVGDNGVGLPADFDFRQADTLGLSLVNMLVSQLGGALELSQQGGTVFRITFRGLE